MRRTSAHRTTGDAGSPEEPVQTVQGRPRLFAFEHGDLLSEGENFEGGVAATAEEHPDGGQDGEDEFGHGLTLVTWSNVARTDHQLPTAS